MRRLWLGLVLLHAYGCTSYGPTVTLPHDVSLPRLDYPGLLVRGASPGQGEWAFLLDTGANTSCFDRGRATANGLPITLLEPAYTAYGSSGVELTSEWTTFERLDFGDASVFSFSMPLLDLDALLPPIDGIIGQDVLRNWAVLADPARREVLLIDSREVRRRLENRYPGRSFTALPIDWSDRLPYLDLSIPGAEKSRFLLDTGAWRTGVTSDITRTWRLPDTGNWLLSWGIGGAELETVVSIDGLDIGGWRFAGDVSSSATRSAGLLGWDFLGDVVFVVDGPASTLWLESPPPPSP